MVQLPTDGTIKNPKKPLHVYPEQHYSTQLLTHIGIDSYKRNGIHCLDDSTVLMAAGNFILFVDYRTSKIKESIIGPEGGSIGVIDVHPSYECFAVCESRESNPEIQIYNYPEKKKLHTLKKGAVRGFFACAFNHSGTMLATIACEPDFMLTVWDWERESIILRSKDFGVDVYTIAFSMYNDSILTTSGKGHIKFWEMANTFTGRKLSGAIGKFGKVELSDVAGFAYFPDEKVISGSEQGSLLLWEGNLIKCELMCLKEIKTGGNLQSGEPNTHHTLHTSTPHAKILSFAASSSPGLRDNALDSFEGKQLLHSTSSSGKLKHKDYHGPLFEGRSRAPSIAHELVKCHQGGIEIVMLVEEGRLVLTVGEEGYVRYWSQAEINLCETDGMNIHVGIKCLKELFLGKNVRGLALTSSKDGTHWILLDRNGAVRTFPHWSYEQIMDPEFNKDSAAPVPTSPQSNFFSGSIISCELSRNDHTVACGGEDGTLRVFSYLTKEELFIIKFDSAIFSITPFPKEIDPYGTLLLCGFEDGSIRLVQEHSNRFEVLGAWRPHEAALCGVAMDATATQIYTIAEDQTAFYFRIKVQEGSPPSVVIEPVGYCALPQSNDENINSNPALIMGGHGIASLPTSLEWTIEGDACLVGFSNGNILGILPPEPGIDLLTETGGYEFPVKYFGLGILQKRRPPPKEKKIVGGEEVEESSDEDKEEEAQGPWAVLCIKRLPVVSQNDPDRGYIIAFEESELAYRYRCTIRYNSMLGPPPIPTTGVDPPNRVEEPLENVCFRNSIPQNVYISGTKLLTVCENCRVFIRDLTSLNKTDAPVTEAHRYHDNMTGRINGVGISFDGTVLISVGNDGVIVTQSLEGTTPPDIEKLTLNHAKTFVSKEAAIETGVKKVPGAAGMTPEVLEPAFPVAHSIKIQKELDNKQKAEEQARGKKDYLLNKINSVLLRYQQVIDDNNQVDENKKLLKNEVVLDPDLQELLKKEMQRRVDDAALAYSWKACYKATFLEQLRVAFMDTLDYDLFYVYSFTGDVGVPSLRTPALTKKHKAAFSALFEKKKEGKPGTDEVGDSGQELSDKPSEFHGEASDSLSPLGKDDSYLIKFSPVTPKGDIELEDKDDNSEKEIKNMLAASLNAKRGVKIELEKAEERKQARLAIKKENDELMARKPKPTDPVPKGEVAILDAQTNPGTYIVKSDPTFCITTNRASTAQRKARQLAILENVMNQMGHEFNKRLLDLRDLKKKLCETFNQERNRLIEVVTILDCDVSEIPNACILKPEEEPEKKFDIDKAGLQKYTSAKLKQAQRLEAQMRAKKGFGADLAQDDDDEMTKERDADGSEGNLTSKWSNRTSSRSGVASASHEARDGALTTNADRKSVSLSGVRTSTKKSIVFGNMSGSKGKKPSLGLKEKQVMEITQRLENTRLSDVEGEEIIICKEQLSYEKKSILSHMEAIREMFDKKLKEFSQVRVKLEDDISRCRIRQLLLFREYRMLLNFKHTDDALETKLSTKNAELQKLGSSTAALKRDVEKTQQDQTDVAHRLQAVIAEGENYLKTNFPEKHQAYMKKVFLRHIQRVTEGELEDDDDDSTSEDEDEDEDRDADFKEELPPNCDEAHWQHLLELRKRRLDCEDETAAIKKKVTQLLLTCKQIDEEERHVQEKISLFEKEFCDFQIEKQKQLNLLTSQVNLKLRQIQCLIEDNKMPRKIDNSIIVFSTSGMERLRQRIVTLADDKVNIQRDTRQLQMAKRHANNERRQAQLVVDEWEDRLEEVEFLKFGQKIDLEALEDMAIDQETEELKELLKLEQIRWERNLRKETVKHEIVIHEGQMRVCESTMLLKDIGGLRKEQKTLEHALTRSTDTIMSRAQHDGILMDSTRHYKLRDLIITQQRELDAMKGQITAYRRKDRHIPHPKTAAAPVLTPL